MIGYRTRQPAIPAQAGIQSYGVTDCSAVSLTEFLPPGNGERETFVERKASS